MSEHNYLHFYVFFGENKGIMLQTLRAKQKYQVTIARFILETDDPSSWIIRGEGSSV